MQLADIPSLQSATLGLHPIAHNRWATTTHFPSRWRYKAELAGAHSRLATCSRLLAVDRVRVKCATSWLRVRYCTVVIIILQSLLSLWRFAEMVAAVIMQVSQHMGSGSRIMPLNALCSGAWAEVCCVWQPLFRHCFHSLSSSLLKRW